MSKESELIGTRGGGFNRRERGMNSLMSSGKGFPGAVEKNMTHASVVWNSEREVLQQVHLFEITGDTIHL